MKTYIIIHFLLTNKEKTLKYSYSIKVLEDIQKSSRLLLQRRHNTHSILAIETTTLFQENREEVSNCYYFSKDRKSDKKGTLKEFLNDKLIESVEVKNER